MHYLALELDTISPFKKYKKPYFFSFQLPLHRPVQLPAVHGGLPPLRGGTGRRGGIVSGGRILPLRAPSDGEGGGGGGAGGEDRVGGKVREKIKYFL